MREKLTYINHESVGSRAWETCAISKGSTYYIESVNRGLGTDDRLQDNALSLNF